MHCLLAIDSLDPINVRQPQVMAQYLSTAGNKHTRPAAVTIPLHSQIHRGGGLQQAMP